MPDEQPTRDPLDRARQIELDILYALTDEENPPLWTLDELCRELDVQDIAVYTRPLRQAGLIHSTSDGHIFASRAAVRQVQLVGHGVI